MINIEVTYSTERFVELIPLSVNEGTTVIEAIHQSGIIEIHPEANIETGNIGIYGKVCSQNTVLSEGDRVEIYRPLLADPKEARRARASRQQEKVK